MTTINVKTEVETNSDKGDEEDVELEIFKQYMEANQRDPSYGVITPESIWKSLWDLIMFIWIIW